MQPTEGFSVPRRVLDVEDYIDILRRHKGWIFGPFLLTLVASVVGVYLAPDSYVSEAVVKVQPQLVPQNMVASAINQEMTDRINSMSQTILSRSVLTTIINNFGLYLRERNREPLEDVIEEMRKKIKILPVENVGGPGRQVPAFVVQFSYENRILAQRVVQELVTRFIDENIRNRSNATFVTTQFLKDEVDQSHKVLEEVENKLTEFRVQNNGRLPDQVDSNMRQLQALEASSTYLANAMSRAGQEKLQMETNLRIFKDQLAELNKQPAPDAIAQQQKSERLADVDREIDSLQNSLTLLRQRFRETYPDVQAAVLRLNAAKEKRESILKEETDNKKDIPAPVRPVNVQAVRDARELSAAIQRAESAIASKDVEVEEYKKELKATNGQIKAYQGRIETVPLGEKQYGDLLRDQSMAKENYQDLEGKLSKAELAKEMEDRKQGEVLEVLDPASLPQTPTEPKRPLVISIGAAIGLLLGIVIAGAREMKDTTLKNLKDVRAYTQMSILGSIPLLENDFVVRRRRRLGWLGWTTACLVAAVVMSGSVVYYYVTKV